MAKTWIWPGFRLFVYERQAKPAAGSSYYTGSYLARKQSRACSVLHRS